VGLPAELAPWLIGAAGPGDKGPERPTLEPGAAQARRKPFEVLSVARASVVHMARRRQRWQ
jgi:hypothetical protein